MYSSPQVLACYQAYTVCTRTYSSELLNFHVPAAQVQELQLIQHSLLPGESFSFILSREDSRIWHALLDPSTDAITSASAPTSPNIPTPIPQAKFQVRALHARIWFEVQFPEGYPDVDSTQVPSVSVNGEGISRDEHNRWRTFVQEKSAEVQGNE